jgi:hypothetical protein
MSGGAYDYICYKLSDINVIRVDERNPKRWAFQELLTLVAKAMHDIEWVDSGDKSDGDENEAIDACLHVLRINVHNIEKIMKYEEIERIVNESND